MINSEAKSDSPVLMYKVQSMINALRPVEDANGRTVAVVFGEAIISPLVAIQLRKLDESCYVCLEHLSDQDTFGSRHITSCGTCGHSVHTLCSQPFNQCAYCNTPYDHENNTKANDVSEVGDLITKKHNLNLEQTDELKISEATRSKIPMLQKDSERQLQSANDMNNEETKQALKTLQLQYEQEEQDRKNAEAEVIAKIQNQQLESQKQNIAGAAEPSSSNKDTQLNYNVLSITAKEFYTIIRNNYKVLKTSLTNNPTVFEFLLNIYKENNIFTDYYITKIREKETNRDQAGAFLDLICKDFPSNGIPIKTRCRFILASLLTYKMLPDSEADSDILPKVVAEESRSWGAEKTKKIVYDVSSVDHDKFSKIIRTNYTYIIDNLVKDPETFDKLLTKCKEENLLKLGRIKEVEEKILKRKKISKFLDFIGQGFVPGRGVDRDFASRKILMFFLENKILFEEKNSNPNSFTGVEPGTTQEKNTWVVEPAKSTKYILSKSVVTHFKEIIFQNYGSLPNKLANNPELFLSLMDECKSKNLLFMSAVDHIEQIEVEKTTRNKARRFVDIIESFFNPDRIDCNTHCYNSATHILMFFLENDMLEAGILQEKTDDGKITVSYQDKKAEIKTPIKQQVRNIAKESELWVVDKTDKPKNNGSSAQNTKKSDTPNSVATATSNPVKTSKLSKNPSNDSAVKKHTPAQEYLSNFYSILLSNKEKIKEIFIENDGVFEFLLEECINKQFIDDMHKKHIHSKDNEDRVISFINYFSHPQEIDLELKNSQLPGACAVNEGRRVNAAKFLLRFFVDNNMLVNL